MYTLEGATDYMNQKTEEFYKRLAEADERLKTSKTVPHFRCIRGFYMQSPGQALPDEYVMGERAHIVFRERLDIKSYHEIKPWFIRRAKALGANALVDVSLSNGQFEARPAILLEYAAEDDDYKQKIARFKAKQRGKESDPLIISYERQRMVKLEKEVSYWRGHNDGYYLNHSSRGKFPPSDEVPEA